jgi:hypothetical protein
VLEGDNQTITCTVFGKPVATDVSWTKFSNVGFETIDRTAVPEKYLGGTNENPTLVIKDFHGPVFRYVRTFCIETGHLANYRVFIMRK